MVVRPLAKDIIKRRKRDEQIETPPEQITAPEKLPEGSLGKADTAGSPAKRQIRAGEYEYTIGDNIVSKQDYELAVAAMKGSGLHPDYEKRLGGLGLEPFAEQQRRQEMIKQERQQEAGIAQQEQITGAETPIDRAQVWAQLRDPANLMSIAVAGGVGAWAGTKAGGVIGGIVGTSVIPGIGTAAGAAGGATIGGFVGAIGGAALATWKVVDANIKDQRVDNIKAQLSINRDAQTYKNNLVMLANVDPANADVYWNAWMEIDAKQRQAWSQLQIDARSDLNLRLGEDATKELQRFENYYEGGGYMTQRARMEQAIAAPDFTAGVYGLMMSQAAIGED